MPWITTKDGKHINTDWFTEDADRKEKQIAANKEEATEKNESPKYQYFKGKKVTQEEFDRLVAGNKLQSLKGNVRDSKELLPKNTYTDRTTYKEAVSWLRENAGKREELSKKYLDAAHKLDAARDSHLDPEYVKILGRQEARILVEDKDYPDTAQARQEYDKISLQLKEFDREIEMRHNLMSRLDAKEAETQRADYGRPEFKEAKGEYPGFKLNESTTTNIDRALKEGRAKIVEMAPEQYIRECAHYVFTNSTMEKTLRGRIGDKDTEKYAKMMREGVKFDTPYIDYNREAQEGLHRAVAAYMNGLEKMPVIIVGKRRY